MSTIPRLASPCAAALLILLAGSTAEAAPVRYHYDDTQHRSPGGWGPMGVGEFTFDIGTELRDYVAWDVEGGPGSRAGFWTSVIFSVHPGSQVASLAIFAPLSITDPTPNGLGLEVPALGGPDASAEAEWAHLLARFGEGNGLGIVITPVSIPTGVPESASLGWGIAIGLGLTALYCRPRGRRQAHPADQPAAPTRSA